MFKIFVKTESKKCVSCSYYSREEETVRELSDLYCNRSVVRRIRLLSQSPYNKQCLQIKVNFLESLHFFNAEISFSVKATLQIPLPEHFVQVCVRSRVFSERSVSFVDNCKAQVEFTARVIVKVKVFLDSHRYKLVSHSQDMSIKTHFEHDGS